MLYVFGYGSLIFADGANKRTPRVYTDQDFVEARLLGYRREFNAVYDNMRFLGLIEHADWEVNGTLLPLNEKHFNDFADSECSNVGSSTPLYNFIDVTSKIIILDNTFKLGIDDRVITCVTVKPSLNGNIPDYYLKILMNALITRGREFESEFWKTTYVIG